MNADTIDQAGVGKLMQIVKDAMSAEDKFHSAVRNALIKAGWTITDEPLIVEAEPKEIVQWINETSTRP